MSEIKPYQSNDNKRSQVERMFDGIAPNYDLLNHVLSFGIDKGWRRKAIAMVSEHNPSLLLDVATGTADMAIAAQRAIGCQVVGCDISQQMINVGVKKVSEAGLTEKVSLRQADSEDLPFECDSFDAVTVAFGVRNFAHLDKGLAEMARVLKHGGRLMVLEFSTPSNSVFRAVYNFYFRHILPKIGGLVSKDTEAYDYLCTSAMAFPSGEKFQEHLKGAGLENIKMLPLTFGIATAYLAEKP